MSVIDHKAQAQSRAYSQYQAKTKLMAWVGINGEVGNEIEAVYQHILDSYDIDTAGTNELDVIGRIVGVARTFDSQDYTDAFEFGATQFNRAQFRAGSGINIQPLNNAIYRLLIKSKISKNSNDATIDGMIVALSFLLETDGIVVVDNEDMTFSFIFDVLTRLERIVITSFDIIAKPQGVNYLGFTELAAVPQFGRQQFGYRQFGYTHIEA